MPGPGLEIIPLAVYLLPVSGGISILVKIILMTVDNLSAGLIIGSLWVCKLPAIIIMVPAWSVILRSCYQCLFKRVPGVLCMVINKRIGTDFSGHIMVTDYPISLITCIPDTQLDPQAITISTIRMHVLLGTAMSGNVLIFYGLPYISAKSHIIMSAGSDILWRVVLQFASTPPRAPT